MIPRCFIRSLGGGIPTGMIAVLIHCGIVVNSDGPRGVAMGHSRKFEQNRDPIEHVLPIFRYRPLYRVAIVYSA